MFTSKQGTKIETVIGPSTEFEGNIQTGESLRIDGRIKGQIKADTVVIGPNAAVIGDVSSNIITVNGKIKGNVSAATRLEILPAGHICGDIRTAKLIISDGARFEGHCQMITSNGQVIEFNPDIHADADPAATNGSKKHQKVMNG